MVTSETMRAHDLIAKVKQYVGTASPVDHENLELQAQHTHIDDYNNFDDYIKADQKIRTEMVASKYPNIKDEWTTNKFILQGMETHEEYKFITPLLRAQRPTSIKQLQELIKSIVPRLHHTGKTSNDHTKTLPYVPNLSSLHSIPPLSPTLCRFHYQLRGRMMPHSEAQCRDP